ncbi:MAG: FGGY-family carbohydrate kinase [Saccharofermentanales bacterium]
MKFIAYDLGTGGIKASLYDEKLNTIEKTFIEYSTYYPKDGYHEQRPEDWWQAVIESTTELLQKTKVDPSEIACVSLSGHSLVTVPIDAEGELLSEFVPIWSDSRAVSEAQQFFQRIDEEKWYSTTGNGFPAPLYSVFKLMWLKDNQPDIFKQIYKILGSKDYINYRLTGNFYTDHSYASGFGVYNLNENKLEKQFLDVAGIPEAIFPEIVNSHFIVGKITKEAAKLTGLPEGTSVACGGVDNACMALGAVGAEEGAVYLSLGSSSWIAVNSEKPMLDYKTKPYVFVHIQENMYTSAYSIFSAGSSLTWVRDTICQEIEDTKNAYRIIDELALQSPPGSNDVVFNPSLAGGTSQDKSVNIRGAYLGLGLGTSKSDILRATLEGIAMNLKLSYNQIAEKVELSKNLLICGGGSKSKIWLQMFADIFNVNIIKTNIDQDAASLGAAAISAKAMGLWDDYSQIKQLHQVEHTLSPDINNSGKYNLLEKRFTYIAEMLSDYGDYFNRDQLY